MSKTIGCVDDEGDFYLVLTFDTRSSNDMEEMIKLLKNEESAIVKTYDSESVEVTCKPDCFRDYGF